MPDRRKSGLPRKSGGGGGGGRRRRTTMSSLPEEICNEILLKLPVESLLRCKSVCKKWYALISTSQFVRKHHTLTIQKNNPNLFLKVYAIDEFYTLGYDSLPSSSSPVCAIRDYAIELAAPYRFSPSHYSCVGFLGSSNGLIGIWFLNRRYGLPDKNLFCLWNPATRQFKELPESPIGFNRNNLCIHGLGYDHKTDDYKLVIGVKVPGSKDSILVQVYTLASNLWKMEKTIPYRFRFLDRSGVFVNGNLHWLALGLYNNISVLSLDISEESFKELELPRQVQEMNKKDLCLGVLQGCLCLLVSSDVNGGSEVWEMLDYGIQESWIKHSVIAHEGIIDDQKYFRLVQSYKKDEILLLGSDTLVLYDPKQGSARELKIYNFPFRCAETYFESLVSLHSGTYVVGERQATTEETKARVRNLRKMSMYLIILIAYVSVVFVFY